VALEAAAAAPARRAPELLRRLATAAVALPPAVWLLWRGGWAAAALLSAAAGLATWEFLRLAVGRDRSPALFVLACAATLPWLPVVAPAHAEALALALVAATSLTAWGSRVLRQDVEGAAREAPLELQALVFCAAGPFCLVALRELPNGRALALATVAATFANDAAAYGGGRLLGRHPLAPRVSPGKTWEGWACGALGGALAALAPALLWPGSVRPSDAAAIAAVTAVLGPLGDLSKSALERARGAKDSGGLLPGHGGMLDRIDALCVSSVALWAWARFAP